MNPKRPVLLAYCGAHQIPSLSYGSDTSTCGVLQAASLSEFSLVRRAALNKAIPPPWDSYIQRLPEQGVGSPGPLIQMGQH